jgi:hypothetical protein
MQLLPAVVALLEARAHTMVKALSPVPPILRIASAFFGVLRPFLSPSR